MAVAFGKRKPPKLLACMTKGSLETVRNKALFAVDFLDDKAVRRKRLPLHECLLLELRESGYVESADYLQDLMYDNMQLVADDDIGIIVDIKTRDDYLSEIAAGLKQAENEKERGETKRESMFILKMAMAYAERGKGIIWLAEKFYLVAIAIASSYLIDGGRQKAVCKYHYAKFLLDKFPQADPEESYLIMTEVRDISNGKAWLLYEKDPDDDDADDITELPTITVFVASAIQLHRLLLCKLRAVRPTDPDQAERLSRLAERRAKDAQDKVKQAEAIIEMGISQMQLKNLNNAYKTFQRALDIYTEIKDIKGVCEAKMHLAAVLQRFGDHQNAASMLTEMGSLAMEHGLRKQLGRALHLLGELHLRRGRPELGTEHLAEAFSCFMGFTFQEATIVKSLDVEAEMGQEIYKPPHTDVSEEEAEQSRLMMAVSAGQELMASYFHEVTKAGKCNISRHKIIEWKLSKSAWWYDHHHHKLFTCPCPEHNRSPIDVLRLQFEALEQMRQEPSQALGLFRTNTVEDIRKLRSSFRGIKSQPEVDNAVEEHADVEKEERVIEKPPESEQG